VAKDGNDYFRIFARGGHPVIEGTSPAVLLTGFNWYLKYVVHANITWNGQELNLPHKLPVPGHGIRHDASVPNRFALNDTNDAYTEPYAGWSYWQHEIDVLALHGINEVLVYTGQSTVYYRTLQQYGYSANEIRHWIPNPAHQPWWLLQNMCCFAEPISQRLLDRRVELGRKIADRLRSLGMTPVYPGYYGTVPRDFEDRNAGAHVVAQGAWGGGGFRRPGWLDPAGKDFPKVAKTFYRVQQKLFGPTSIYKMDLLHEGGRAGNVDVGAASKAVQTALETAHPGARWAILGWQHNPLPATIKAIDKSKMLILDGISDRNASRNRESRWNGTPYAFGSIWNFGGHTTMGANMSVWNRKFWAWHDKTASALAGIAMMPEASDNNPAAFEFFTELAWRAQPVDLDTWFNKWATYRYGGHDPAAQQAWHALADTAYSMPGNGWSQAQGSAYQMRPSLNVNSADWPASGNLPKQMRYKAAQFARALPALLRVNPHLRDSSAYRYDLMSVTRQVLANRSHVLLPKIKAAYESGDLQRFRKLSAAWLHNMQLVDKVVGTNKRMLLGAWLQHAREIAAGAKETARLEYGARSLVTVWGNKAAANGGLHDYANREWQGLVGDYYYSRWKAYFGSLAKALKTGHSPKPIDWYAFGKRWAQHSHDYPTQPSGDIHRIAARVYKQLR
jgi:alpha-N-acetylglucosaminidase